MGILIASIIVLLGISVYFEFSKQDFGMFLQRNFNFVLLSLFIVAGLVIRSQLFFFESGDYLNALLPWYKKLEGHGGFEGVRHFAKISDYAPSYLYFLAFLAEFHLTPLIGIKVFSVAFDLVLSCAAFLIVRQISSPASKLPALAFGLVFFCPTVLTNSSFWGQCDTIHATFILFSVYCLLKKRNAIAILFWGLAFAFKIQSIFVFLPFLVLFFAHRIKTSRYLLLPIPYLLLGIPAYLLKAEAIDVLQVYVKQTDNYPHYTMHAPTLFCLLPNFPWHEEIKSAAIGLAITLGIAAALLFSSTRKEITSQRLLLLFFLSSLLFPFVLPKMHERYFLLADVLGILFAFAYRQYWYLPILVIFSSFTSYYPFLFEAYLVEMKYTALLQLFVIIKLIQLSYREFYQVSEPPMA